MEANTKTALEIFSNMIRNIPVNEKINKDLYRILTTNSMVEADLREIVEMFELDLYRDDSTGFFVVAKANNKVFGYTNEELKNLFSLRNNKELYISYFIIYSIISTFYIQSNYRTQVEFITSKSLLDKVDEKLRVLSSNNEVNEDSDNTFSSMYNYWNNELTESSQKNKETVDFNEKGKKTRISLINKILSFLVANKYMEKDDLTNRYAITSRFEEIIKQFFDDANTKAVLQDILNMEIENR